MIRLHLKQQSRYEIQNLLGTLKEKVAKIHLLVAISVCQSVCAQVRNRQSCEICDSHGAVFWGIQVLWEETLYLWVGGSPLNDRFHWLSSSRRRLDTCRWKHHDLSKRRYPLTQWHSIISQKAWILNSTTTDRIFVKFGIGKLIYFFIIIPPLNTAIWDLMLCSLIEICRYLENLLP